MVEFVFLPLGKQFFLGKKIKHGCYREISYMKNYQWTDTDELKMEFEGKWTKTDE